MKECAEDFPNKSDCGEPTWNEQYKTVIDRGRTYLIERMQPERILDVMQQSKFLPFTDCRDISELKFTTDKNRTIIDKIRSMGENGYKQFKRFLEITSQTDILKHLQTLEEDQKAPNSSLALRNTTGYSQVLKDELIKLYGEHYVKAELSPLRQGHQSHIDNIYVPLEMEDISRSRISQAQLRAEKEIKTFRDIFYTNGQIVDIVFISAVPGNGKTTFCRKLVSVWCKAHINTDDSESIQQESDDIANLDMDNLETMKTFDFLFFVYLSDMSGEAQVEDMITNQIKIDTFDNHAIKCALRSRESKCLIILDGLDEWSAPEDVHYRPSDIKGLPKTDRLCNCHILVTTRPWKLTSITQINPEKHKEVNVIGMTDENSKCFIKSFLNLSHKMVKEGHIHRSHKTRDTDKLSDHFIKEIHENDMFHLSATPLVLKLLLCFWLECGKLRNSVCQIYGAIIDLLLENGYNKNKHDKVIRGIASTSTKFIKCKSIPKCFRKLDYLEYFSEIVLPLGQFSFHALLSGTDNPENMKVKSRDLELLKDTIELNMCSKLGIISQTPVFGESFLYNKSTINFLHRSFEEFYAALYIAQDPKLYIPTVLKTSNTFDQICKHSNMYKFLGGMCPDVAGKIINHIGRVAKDLGNSVGVYNKRKLLSEIMFKIFIEYLNCKGGYTSIKIDMHYLPLYDNKYSKYLPYIKYSALRVVDINNVKLTHIQLRKLLAIPKELKSVIFSNRVEFIEDDKCGCKSKHDIQTVNDVSFVKELTATDVKGLFVHTLRCPMLQELDLDNLTLHHAQITCLLIDSKYLARVKLRNLNCRADQRCGICGQENNKYFSRLAVSYMKELSVVNGSGIFPHIHHFARIDEVYFNTIELSHTEMSRLFSSSEHLRKITLLDVNCTKDKLCECESPREEHAKSSALKVLTSRGGREILEHIRVYPKLQELDIFDIKLTHIQITCLLTTPFSIDHVKLAQVYCEPVSGCGCLDRVEDAETDVYIQVVSSANDYSTPMKVCEISKVSGIFAHIQRYQRLTELQIKHSGLTHTQITRLLTASPRLHKVNLQDVTCKSDFGCGCLTSDHLAMCSKTSLMELCSVEGGSGIFDHVRMYPKLQELKIIRTHLSLTKILDIISESPDLFRLTLAGIEYVQSARERAGYATDDESTTYVQLLHEIIICLLQHLRELHRGLYITLEDMALTPSNADNLLESVKDFDDVQMEEFKDMKCSELDIEHSYSMKLRIKASKVITESIRL